MTARRVDHEMQAWLQRLFPIHRSMTGRGLRETYAHLAEFIPLEVKHVPTGTQVFDWTIPQEWSIEDAFIASSDGSKLVDYTTSNLHVCNGSDGVNRTMPWDELAAHVYSLPNRPQAIPYRTNFFRSDWGFCVCHDDYQRLSKTNAPLHAYIAARHFDGGLDYAELTIPGQSERSVVVYAHTCHPSLANDNLSGLIVAAFLARELLETQHRFTYRFVFAPATIGAIAWLAINEMEVLPLVDYGLVLALLGGNSPFNFKRSRLGNAEIDAIGGQMMSKHAGNCLDFTPSGYDERQFCSPGLNLPFGRLTRSPPGEFPEYHTSDDNLNFVHGKQLAEALDVCLDMVRSIESRQPAMPSAPQRCLLENCPVGVVQKGEPMLGRRNLFTEVGIDQRPSCSKAAIQWVLNLSDGYHTIQDMVARSRLSLTDVTTAIGILHDAGLLKLPSRI